MKEDKFKDWAMEEKLALYKCVATNLASSLFSMVLITSLLLQKLNHHFIAIILLGFQLIYQLVFAFMLNSKNEYQTFSHRVKSLTMRVFIRYGHFVFLTVSSIIILLIVFNKF